MDSMRCIVLKIDESTCIVKNPLNSYNMIHVGISGGSLCENVFCAENDMYKSIFDANYINKFGR